MKLPAMMMVPLLVLLAATLASGHQSPLFDCSGGNYSAAGSYWEKMDLLSAELPVKVATSPRLFARDSIVSGEAVFAVARCRGDTERSSCTSCVTEAAQEARLVCPLRTEVYISYPLCTLQLSQKIISWAFGVNTPVDAQLDSTVQSKAFARGTDALFSSVARIAANTPQMYATAVEEICTEDGARYTAYGLAQCIPEMGHADCARCLEDVWYAYSDRPVLGGRFDTPFCGYEFHVQPFFAGEPMLQLPTVTPPRGNNKRKSVILGVAVGGAALLVVIILALLAWVILRRKRQSSRQKQESSIELSGVETSTGDVEAGPSGAQDTPGPSGAQDTPPDARPSAIDCFAEIMASARGRRILLFLDYDGTLSPIVANPMEARMTDEMLQTVRDAAEQFLTSIVTGRCIEKARQFVQLESLHYAGSHGMDIAIRGHGRFQPLPQLEATVTEATERLVEAVRGINGAVVENNTFCVSVHYRNVVEKDWKLIEDTINNILTDFPDLKLAHGKMVWELRSRVEFNKGDAVDHLFQYLLQHLGVTSSQVFAIYLGDDRTDEDAFQLLRERGYGFGILVSTRPKPTEAFYSVRDPLEVMKFLRKLVDWSTATAESEILEA